MISSVTLRSPLVSVTFHPKQDNASSETASDYNIFWLRDNCRCSKCFLTSSNQRMYHPSLQQFQTLSVKNVSISNQPDENSGKQVSEGKNYLEVFWTDDHKSVYEDLWLWKRAWLPEFNCTRFFQEEKEEYLEPLLWDGEELQKRGGIPTFQFDAVLTDNKVFQEWCRVLIQTGLTLLTNAPTQEGQVKRLAKRVAFLETTNYGKVFRVEAKKDPSNVAYSNIPLECHTDLAYQKLTPGVQILHCIKQSEEGGENMFVDAFKIANWMRVHQKPLFDILSTWEIAYWDLGSDYLDAHHYSQQKTVFDLDRNGNVEGINFNHNTRDSFLNLAPEKMSSFYEAYYTFFEHTRDEKFLVRNRLNSGDMVVFANRRILHGRQTFSSPNSSAHESIRLLEGGYIRIEDVMSRYRVLKNVKPLIGC